MDRAVQAVNELVSSNKAVNSAVPSTSGYDYNCWGFTAALHGWSGAFYWMHDDEMDEFLEDRTIQVLEPAVGDIIVFRRDAESFNDDNDEDCWGEPQGELRHTGTVYSVMNGVVKIVHKPGSCALCVETLAQIDQRHGDVYGRDYTFRRITQ